MAKKKSLKLLYYLATKYGLCFRAADGSMYINKGGYGYISFTSADLELVQQVKKSSGSPIK